MIECFLLNKIINILNLNAYLTLKDNTIIHYYMGNFYNKNSYSGFKYNDVFFKIKLV